MLQQQGVHQGGAPQYPRIQPIEPNKYQIRKTQKDAESESESDDSSSSSDSGTISFFSSFLFNIDSDKDKKKSNIKRASGPMMGAPGGPGGNPGAGNLSSMWKRTQ